jgi:hypothetical protein
VEVEPNEPARVTPKLLAKDFFEPEFATSQRRDNRVSLLQEQGNRHPTKAAGAARDQNHS